VTAWVLLVVPVLGLSLALMVAALPRLVATAADSLHLHWDLTVEHWAQGELARTATGIVGLVAITAPLLGIGLLLSRMATRTGRRIWRAADGDPRRQAGVVLAGAALVLALGSAWWPDGQYEPIDADDRGALVDGIGAISAGALGEVPVRAADAGPATEAQGLAADRQADALTEAAEVRAPFVLAPSSSAPQRRSFVPPPPPGEGDNQAVAINRTDGATLVDVSPSLVWAGTDAPVTSRNEAYALASCRDCTTLAVAFQVVVVVGSNDAVAPENEAVAVNAGCEACTTRSLAMQTVVTLPDEPSAGEMDDLERIWSRVEGILAAAGSSTVDETFQRLAAVEAEILGVLEDAQGVPDHDLDSYDAPGPDPADDASNDTTPTTTEATAGSVPADTTGSTSSTSTTSTTTASTTTASTTSTTAPTGTTAPTETEP
jgi:putative peptide zinc metalloprotease protein